MPQPKVVRLVLGDQLDELHSWFKTPDRHVTYVMMEIRQETDYVKHQIQKVAAFFAAMRAFSTRLKESGHRVIYLCLDDRQNRQTITANLQHLVKTKKFSRMEYLLPDEYRLNLQLKNLAKKLQIDVRAFDTEHFMTERHELKDFYAGKKRFLMESYYRSMRKRHDILMEKDKPFGGQWNYDQKNRQAYEGHVAIPHPLFFKNDISDICKTIKKMQVKTFGDIEPARLIWPTTRAQSLNLLRSFVKKGLPAFGTYQDDMTADNWHLFHCRLSFALNTKILRPLEVIQAAINAWDRMDTDEKKRVLAQASRYLKDLNRL